MLPLTPVIAEEDVVTEISSQLICQCGCSMVLSTCECTLPNGAAVMTALIREKRNESKPEEVLDFFVAQYGQQVLASLPRQGLNPVLWILAPVAILGGGGVIYIVLKKWVRRGRRSQTITMGEEESKKYRRQLEKELEEFTNGGFR